MRSASAFRREAPRCPPGERREPLGACGPLASAPDPALVPFRGWAAGRRRLLSAKTFSLPLFPGLLTAVSLLRWWSCFLKVNAFAKAGKLKWGSLALQENSVMGLATLSTLSRVGDVTAECGGAMLHGISCWFFWKP